MITTELYLLLFLFIFCLSTINAIAGRCYLCSENTLAECAGSTQTGSSIYKDVLLYYTEPCNGQCVLFRNENRSIIRGCSWTYGHMTAKSIGWHDISPGIKAYFCNTHLCNNGTFEQPEIVMNKIGIRNNQIVLSPQQLFVLANNNPVLIQTGHYLSRRFHQCYSCTARFEGCGEFLDPHYASNYIRPCSSSCIIFRNPNDLNLITRDCSTFWPQVHATNGLQKLLGSDAFFCQEPLCNGISFDFIRGIFYHQLPTVITFPPVPSTTTTSTLRTTIDIYNDNMIWDDPDLDYGLIEFTINNLTTSSIPMDEFDFTDEIFPNTTIVSNLTIAEANSSLISLDSNDTSLSSSPLTSTSISSTIPIDNDDWTVFNTSFILPTIQFEYLSAENDTEDFFSFDIESSSEESNDTILSSISTTPSIIDVIDNQTHLSFPDYMQNNAIQDHLLDYIKPFPTLAMPPFSWILNMLNQNKSEVRTSTTTKKQTVPLTTTITTTTTTTHQSSTVFFEYCKNKQCYHDGRLNSDCLCICLPTFTGENCETVLCDEEPVHICSFVLEHECQTDRIRYLCPRFCQLNDCSLKKI